MIGMKMKNTVLKSAALCAALALLSLAAGCANPAADADSPGGGGPAGAVKLPKTWLAAESAVDPRLMINKAAYGNGVFAACGYDDRSGAWNSYAAWSVDGVTWTEAEPGYRAAFGPDNMHVFYGNGWFIASPSGAGNNHWARSADGKTWEPTGSLATNFNGKGGVYGNGYWLISGSGGRIAYSTDTLNWTVLSAADTTFDNPGGGPRNFINALACGQGKFVAGGGSGHVACAANPAGPWQTTPKTKTVEGWPNGGELVEVIFDEWFINSMVFAEDQGRFAAVGGLDGGPGKAAYSDDGVNWTQAGDIAPVGLGCKVNGIAYGGGVFVLADNNGNAAYSTDAVTWTVIDDTTFNTSAAAIQTVCYGDGKFIIAGSDGRIAYSIPE
jgi:hypothetical protein